MQLVCLGNPHLSAEEFRQLASLTSGLVRHEAVDVVVTSGREVMAEARRGGHAQQLERFGATLLTDTCWCMLDEPVVPPTASSLITNSAKYAHYAPGLTGRQVRFSSLQGCVAAATSGLAPPRPIARWLGGSAGVEGRRAADGGAVAAPGNASAGPPPRAAARGPLGRRALFTGPDAARALVRGGGGVRLARSALRTRS